MKHATFTAALALTTTLLLSSPASAQQAYPTVPDWVSADTPVSTGGALVDLDRDGWLDLVVANGNDMAQQPVAVYYNQGDGTFPPTPDWQSADTAFHGHLDVADGLGAARQPALDLGAGDDGLHPEGMRRSRHPLIDGRAQGDDDGQEPEKTLFHGRLTP